jgi:3-oxoacyl-(acyl-carrier-protein) synthase
MTRTTERRVVVTGIGVVASNGIGQKAFWHATSNGISGIKPIQRFPTTDLPIKVAGEIQDFMVNDYIDRKLVNRTDRMTHFALAAANEAVQDSGIDIANEDPKRVGTVIANTIGGLDFVLEQIKASYVRGPRYMSAYTAIAWLQVANAAQITIRYGLQGYTKTPVNDAVGGLNALSLAYGAIRRGAADIIIAGGCEASLHPFSLIVVGHNSQYTNCVTGDDPNAYRPFDRRANGLILAEGAGICILEDYDHAQKRGATIYGEIIGYGQTNDASEALTPSSNGTHYARAIHQAMRTGLMRTDMLRTGVIHHAPDIAYISLDGRAIPSSDQGEADALHRVFGADLSRIPTSVPRTAQGHSYAASGAIDTITALLALQHATIPPTINCEQLNPDYGLDMVRDEARSLTGSTVLIGGRGIGGMNVVVAVQKV